MGTPLRMTNSPRIATHRFVSQRTPDNSATCQCSPTVTQSRRSKNRHWQIILAKRLWHIPSHIGFATISRGRNSPVNRTAQPGAAQTRKPGRNEPE